MKKTTKILLASGAVLATGAVTVNALAGGPGPCGHHRASMGPGGMDHRSPERMLERMSKRLDLTEAQQADIKAAFGSDAEQMNNLREQMVQNRATMFGLDPRSADFRERHAELAVKQAGLMQQMMQMRADRKVQIAGILTDSQYAEWREMQEKFGKHGKRSRGLGAAEGYPPNIVQGG